MSRTRQRECLAQRGKRWKGRQNSVVRNYVAEMDNLWLQHANMHMHMRQTTEPLLEHNWRA